MNFKSWLNNYITNDDDYTHLLLDGGKINIPEDKEKEFIKLYSKEIDEGRKVYIIEKRPDVFRYMIDLDIKDDIFWDQEKIIKLVKLIQNVVYEFYKMDLNVICCIAPPHKNKDYVKTGLHLIWPNHYIICEDALILREAILHKIINIEKWKAPTNKWSDVIDELIYIRNGFRMVGSDKIDKNRNPVNRPYQINFVMDSFGKMREFYLERLKKNTESLILDTSIRNNPLENNETLNFTTIPEWIPKDILCSRESRKKKVKGQTRMLGTEEYSIIQKFMIKVLPKVYINQSIKDVRQYPDGNYLIITDSSYCMNIQREHNSCGIYFLATRKGIYQKCLCPCDNLKGRLNGYCKNYTSHCFEFPEDIKIILFPKPEIPVPDKKKKKGKKPVIRNLGPNQRKDNYFKNHKLFCEKLLE